MISYNYIIFERITAKQKKKLRGPSLILERRKLLTVVL